MRKMKKKKKECHIQKLVGGTVSRQLATIAQQKDIKVSKLVACYFEPYSNKVTVHTFQKLQ